MIIYIDEYGLIKENGKFKVSLTGGYTRSFCPDGWFYDIEKIEPKIPLTRLFIIERL